MNVDVSPIDPRETPLVPKMTLPPGMFEPINKTQNQKTPALAMIVCTICKHLAYTPVDDIEYDILLEGGLISRYCHRCGAATSWQHIEWHRPDSDRPFLYQTAQPDRV